MTVHKELVRGFNVRNKVLKLHELTLLSIIFLLSGCGANVVLDKTYPKPLVQEIPLSIGVYYSEEFKAFSQVEEDKDKGKFVINIGAAQVTLFDTLLAGSFSNISQLESFPTKEKGSSFSGVLVPEVVNLQFSIPKHTQAKIFEIWISYNMQLFTPEGALIMEWPLAAYGKTPLKFLNTYHTSFTQATHVALRDAGAQFILSLDKPNLREWLNTQQIISNNPSHAKAGNE